MIATKFLSKLFGKKPKNTVDMWRFPIKRQIKQKQNLSKNFKDPKWRKKTKMLAESRKYIG